MAAPVPAPATASASKTKLVASARVKGGIPAGVRVRRDAIKAAG